MRDQLSVAHEGSRHSWSLQSSKSAWVTTEMLRVLEDYLPAQLGKPEIEALLESAFAETGAASQRDMGKVMSWLKPKISGRADMGLVSSAVKQRLTS